MKVNLFILILFTSISCFSQNHIKGYIFDKTTNNPLPYAAIVLGNSRFYTITNEDGMFEFNQHIIADSLEVRYLGYESKKVPTSYFNLNSVLYLSPSTLALNEVIIVVNNNRRNKTGSQDKTYPYDLLKKLIRKYRKENKVTKSKAYLSLTSSAKNIPIEQIEGYYNSAQSLSGGLVNLTIKSGRFGQNKSLPFYSLNNTKILQNFQFFKIAPQILPHYPGTMLFQSIENNYLIRTEECVSCIGGDVLISFIPKKKNGRLFSGKIYANSEQLIIKKIELYIEDPLTNGIISIIENDIVIPKSIVLNIGFNPLDYSKIQYLDMDFAMFYQSETFKEFIETHSFIYFYDMEGFFEKPYFTKPIHFNNDYDKMIAFQATDDFWDANFQFPKSVSENISTAYLKKFGYQINYDSSIPSVDIQHTKQHVILWNKNVPLSWETIRDTKHHRIDSVSDAHKTIKISHERLNFTYLLDTYQPKKGPKKFIVRTLFDRRSSFYNGPRTKDALDYINLTFNIYEYNRQIMESLITEEMTFSEVKNLTKRTFREASKMAKNMRKVTFQGTSRENMADWNQIIKPHLTD